MRILFVTPYAPARDGIAAYSGVLIDELVRLGHQVAVVSPTDGSVAEPLVLAEIASEPSAAAARRLSDRVAQWRPDVVHVQFAVAAYGVRVLALLRLVAALRRAGVAPIVFTMHEVTRDIGSLRRAGRWLYAWVAAKADRVIAHTRPACTALLSLGVDPARVVRIAHYRASLPVPSVTSTQLRVRHQLGEHPVVLAFGFVHVDKGLPDLVRAVAALVHDDGVPAPRLVVAGAVRPRTGLFRVFELVDRVHLRRVRRLIARCRISDAVTFTGFVPAGEISPWFHLARVAALPYRRAEQSGVVNLARAAGTPLVVSAAGGLTEAAGSAARAIPVGDVVALEGALRDVLRAPVPLDRMPTQPTVVETVAATIDEYRSLLPRPSQVFLDA